MERSFGLNGRGRGGERGISAEDGGRHPPALAISPVCHSHIESGFCTAV